ncbi:hypothetical protein EIN_079620 [Entamoeba invadens IP1]|uniref:hypothetical protein n=1 Tax=Entamoeba invadens IP1 TaxID=370355 RepID=UPI0002C3EDED|nr:hypothetical protein EIN_079620 [Entamoeba invadens IP1]ELP85030.1 hypothetical protein EIN_079620 [Entamoeba invadens IP1]|eukprot:XP_004184376.1 hypothetical protein EIN_079620 [Entamoeba invadens IP1]
MLNESMVNEFTQSLFNVPDSKTRYSLKCLFNIIKDALGVKNVVQYFGVSNPLAVIDFMDRHVLNEKVESDLIDAFEITPELLENAKKVGSVVKGDDQTNVAQVVSMSDERFEYLVRHHRGDPIFEFVLMAFNDGKLSAKKSTLVRRALHLPASQNDIVLGCGYNLSRHQTFDLVNRMLKTSEKRLSSKIIVIRKEKEKVNYFITPQQIDQLEAWTGKKVGCVIFDTNSDDWNKSGSVFGQKILSRKNLAFIIRDTKNNVFGEYVNTAIEQACLIDDDKAFVFSLESNGRLVGMKRFNIKKERKRDAFRLGSEQWEWLFWVGFRDIFVWKKGSEYENFCEQQSFDYEGYQNALCGETNFLVARIIVVQMT